MKLRTLGVAVAVVAIAACSTKKSPPPEAPPAVAATPPAKKMAGTYAEDTVTGTATVQSVDQKTRHVVLKAANGETLTIVAGPEVRNLAQVKKGDVVRVTYHESLAYEVTKAPAGKHDVKATSTATRAPLGAKPAGGVADTVSVRTTIIGIDKAGGNVTLRGPRGRMFRVKVKDPSKLDQVAIGDAVDVTYTEALAVAVEKP